jgi:Cu(I)/Ag(I) efflux system membrane fusion protein/cobalt-zinc-cadmium efflux system membrane fusion protein
MGMDLIPVYEDEIEKSAITIDPITVQNMGLRVTPVKTGKLIRTIRTVGHIDYDEKRLYIINTKTAGWIEKLYVNTTGEIVQKGQPLLEIYSPELVSTQEEYLSSLRSYEELKNSLFEDVRKGASELLSSTRKRLEYWDINEEQIRRLEQTGEIKKTLTLYSPAKGAVIDKNAIEGAFIEAGTNLFHIADLSTVWVLGTIYEYELPFVKSGQKVNMSLSYIPGETFEGKLTYIYPYLNQMTKDVKVRLEFPNPEFELKPEMYVSLVIESELAGERVLIPEEAVIHSGKREVVFVDLGEGKYAPREIQSGASGEGGVIEVKNGLLPGEMVVTSAQFMLDSESKTQEAIQKMMKSRMSASQRAEVDQSPVAKMEEEKVHKPAKAEVMNLNLTPDKKAHFAEEVYTCPMEEHSHILQAGPGICPECGMDLVSVTQTGRTVYTCPMGKHHHILSNQPGECPECGMELVPLKSKSN